MPLVSILGELKKGQANGYAIPCFDTFEMLGAEGILAALERKRAPAAIAPWGSQLREPNAQAFAALLRTMATNASVPVSLLLDHGSSFEQCMKALSYGYSDVMYDGSQLPLEENIATTRLVVRAAHAVGAGVEAELGHVGRGANYDEFGGLGKGFTDPDTVEYFVDETGVDFLAVSIGTAHGRYKGEPHLNLDLLREIRRRVDLPLVLHGGSGLSDEQFLAAIEAGISKINIFTALHENASAKMAETMDMEGETYFNLAEAAREGFRERCAYYLDLFGASGTVR